MKSSMIFITGAAGSGKSTVTNHLKQLLPEDQFDIHDIDEADKWGDDYEAWRDAKIEHWLKESVKNRGGGVTTTLCGIIYPEHVVTSLSYREAAPVSYFLLDAPPPVITERFLQKRSIGSQEEKRLGRPDPGTHLEVWINRQIEISHELRHECSQLENAQIIDSTRNTAQEIAQNIAKQLLES